MVARCAQSIPRPFDAQRPYPPRCRRVLSGRAQASQPSGLRLSRTSNLPHRAVQTVRPFVTASTPLLWPRLTSATTSTRLSTRLARRHRSRPLRVRRVTFLPHTRRIYAGTVRMTLGFESLRPLAHHADASYAIRIPRAGNLPSTSFRSRVAPDTLAVRLGVPVIRASIGTCTRQVTSRFAFAHRLSASGHDAARHA